MIILVAILKLLVDAELNDSSVKRLRNMRYLKVHFKKIYSFFFLFSYINNSVLHVTKWNVQNYLTSFLIRTEAK